MRWRPAALSKSGPTDISIGRSGLDSIGGGCDCGGGSRVVLSVVSAQPLIIGNTIAYPAACRAGADCSRAAMLSATLTNWPGGYRRCGNTTWKVTTSFRSYPGSTLASL